jgi:TATA-binding protein-associated factor Taf7
LIGCQAIKHHAVKLIRNQEYRKELSHYDIETLWQQVDDVLDMVEDNGMIS